MSQEIYYQKARIYGWGLKSNIYYNKLRTETKFKQWLFFTAKRNSFL